VTVASGVAVRIDRMSDVLTPAESRVVRLLREEPDAVREMPIATLAERSGTSQASVVRLCRKLQFKGYKDLRLALAEDSGHRQQLSRLHEDVDADDEPGRILAKVTAATVRTLEDTLRVVDAATLERAVDALRQARTINFAGSGASGSVAQDARFRFLKAGFECHALVDSSSLLTRVATLGPEDVLVVVSHSGRTRDIVAAASEARRGGVFVIGISQFGAHPLANACDVTLFTSSRETAFRSEAMASRVAQLVLLDALFVAVSMPSYDEVAPRLEAARALTEQMRIQP
jgi:RpiR family transcriptional regulator, carbohydrate utilization regulator